jgi:hypothetical protein
MMINSVKKKLPIFTLVYTYMNDKHNACPMIFWNVRTENQHTANGLSGKCRFQIFFPWDHPVEANQWSSRNM